MFWLTKRLRGKNYIALFVVSVQSLKILKHQKTLVCSIICREIENEDVKVFKEEESVKILKILGYNWKYIITLENMSQEFRLKNIDRTRNHFLEEIEQNELKAQKGLYHSKLCGALSYFSFCCYWIYFNFYFCFFARYFYRNYEFCSRFKNL